MCAMKATRPSTTTCPPPGQSKYPTCFTPLALAPLPLMSRLLPLAAASSLASGRPQVASPFSGRGDGRANGPGDQPEKLQHPPEIRPAELDEGVAHAEAFVLAELIDDGLLALGEKLVAQAEAHRDLERLPRAAVRVGRLAELGEAIPKLDHASRRRVPAVAEGDHAAKRGRARAPDPDRRMGFLDGLRREAEVTESEELALEARSVRRPQLLEGAQGLVGLATASVERRAQDLELFLPPPHTESTDETAFRQRVDARQHLGHEHGLAMAQDEHRRAEPGPRRANGRGGEGGHGLEVRPLRRVRKTPSAPVAGAHPGDDDVVAHPERGDVAPLGLARERDQRVAHGLGRLGRREMTADLHYQFLARLTPPQCTKTPRTGLAYSTAPWPNQRNSHARSPHCPRSAAPPGRGSPARPGTSATAAASRKRRCAVIVATWTASRSRRTSSSTCARSTCARACSACRSRRPWASRPWGDSSSSIPRATSRWPAAPARPIRSSGSPAPPAGPSRTSREPAGRPRCFSSTTMATAAG